MTSVPEQGLYCGQVMHMRLAPKQHQFRYAVYTLFLDIDRLPETLGRLRMIAHNRFGLLSFHDRDHGARDASALRPWVDERLARAGLPPADRVMLLSFPRVMGYGFNPLSVYYCYDADGVLQSLIYEVKNTFGDQIAYALAAGEVQGGCLRQTQRKGMYVSPFIELEQTYRFAVRPPREALSLRIRQGGSEGETLIASITGQRQRLTDRALARAFLAYPALSLRVIALIHWHALRLFLKGIRFHRYSQSETAREKGRLKHS